MLYHQLHQYQTHATGPRSKPGLRSLAMRLARIHIAGVLLIIGLCQAGSSTNEQQGLLDKEERLDIDDVKSKSALSEEEEDARIEDDAEGDEELTGEDDLPILPPIILLDFGNGTDSENSTSEDKTKRTVNGGLGYGFERNSLQPGRYNYYFPGGKSGTTVSIEESISPFLPKTIIEKVQPTGQRTQIAQLYGEPSRQNLYNNLGAAARSPFRGHFNFQYTNADTVPKSQPVFGLRGKLHKAPAATSFQTYQSFVSTPKPPVSPYGVPSQLYRNSVIPSSTTPSSLYGPTDSASYVTSNPLSYTGGRGNSFSYFRPNPSNRAQPAELAQIYSGRKQNIQANVNPHSYSSQNQASVESSTVSPFSYTTSSEYADSGSQYETYTQKYADSAAQYTPKYADSAAQYETNTPKYTVENGVRYEHKIFWKYPDGRVSEDPPPTYVETTYPEVPQSSSSEEEAKSQSPIGIYESGSPGTSIHSQGPVQFPAVPELAGQEPSQTPFISAESLSSSLPQQQVYRLGYQNLVTQKQTANLVQRAQASKTASASSSASSGQASSSGNLYSSRIPSTLMRNGAQSPKNNYPSSTYLRPQVVSKYMVNSPNAEYTDTYSTRGATLRSTTPTPSFFTSSGELSPHISSRYTPKVQNYLRTVFPAGGNSRKQSAASKGRYSYANLQYSDLLNYNPSISEYIRNPSSILNVRPTFVQAGNSLIPVIILRVDGAAAPTPPPPASNINLKALLQQYLIQYANSVQDLAQPSNYNFAGDRVSNDQSASPSRTLMDLIQLSRNSDGGAPASYGSDSYTGKSSYETSNLRTVKSAINNKYGERTSARQKVKSVQILENPEYMTYKAKN